MTRPGSPFGSTTRFIALALALGLAGAVAACGGNNDDGGDTQPIDVPDRVAGLPAGVRVHIEHDRITRVFGRAILTGTSPEAVSSEFVTAHSDAFGVRAADLHRTGAATGAQQVMYDPRTGSHKFSLITYEQRSNDVRVFDADVRLLVANRAGSPLTLVASSLRDLDG